MKILPSTHSPFGLDSVHMPKAHYVNIEPEDWRKGLQPGERCSYYQIRKTIRENGRLVHIWLHRIEQAHRPGAKEMNGEICYTWRRKKEEGMKFRIRKEARKAAEKAGGQVIQTSRIYEGEPAHGRKGRKAQK